MWGAEVSSPREVERLLQAAHDVVVPQLMGDRDAEHNMEASEPLIATNAYLAAFVRFCYSHAVGMKPDWDGRRWWRCCGVWRACR